MNAKHTATPWQVIPKNDHGNINYKIANESYTWIIAEMKADTDIDTQENNAKFIVKAVNMHDELVSTLEQLYPYCEGDTTRGIIEKVLSKAKGA